MDSSARNLASRAGRVVVDRTGLEGYYKLTLRYAEIAHDGTPPADDRPMLFTALQERLGLKLEPGQAPLSTLVIDYIDRPGRRLIAILRMMRSFLCVLVLATGTTAAAQSATIDAAKDFYCTPGKAHANAADDPLIEPTKIFDNLYAIGRDTTTVYALTTSEGIVLIDAGYADQLESVLLPGMQKLGLDPARIKYVLVTHGHPDHYGGSMALQQRYGAKVGVSMADAEAMARPGRNGAPPRNVPKQDVVLVEGTPLKVGDTQIDVVAIPGHTPGSLGFIFPVKDGGTTHMAALFGGAVLLPGRLDVPALQAYIATLNHWAGLTRQKAVDVEVQNHPMFDAFELKLAALKARRPGQPNPFVLGRDGYQQFVSAIAGCMGEEVKRHAASAP